MRRDTVIVGIVMLLVGIGVGYGIAIGRLFIEVRKAIYEMGPYVAPAKCDMKVRVLAKQYSWHFHYPGDDGVFGATAMGSITEDNEIGLDTSDPAAADDFVTNELVLPCRKTVGLILTSADVIHALGNLEGDFQEDAIPGSEMTKALATPLSPRGGRLKCVQLCGGGHPNHHAPYQFIPPADFDSWASKQSGIARQMNTNQAGVGQTGAQPESK